VIQTCHRRGVHAMGGMAAQIPIKGDPEANQRALDKVVADKEREAGDGHDGTWGGAPRAGPVAKGVVRLADARGEPDHPPAPDIKVGAAEADRGARRPDHRGGLRQNVNVGLGYIEAWLRGTGCVPLHNLMEDAATRDQPRPGLAMAASRRPARGWRASDRALFRKIAMRSWHGCPPRERGASPMPARVFTRLIEDDEFAEFLTLPAYDMVD